MNITYNEEKETETFCSTDMGSKIFLSMCPMLLLFGTFTNILSLLVLSRKRMRKHSTYVYLAILSVIDLLALWLGITRDFLAHGFNIHIRAWWLCKLHSFFFYYLLDMSSWILVAVSVDRFIAITFVFSSYTKQMLLKLLAKPKMICSVLLAFFALLNLHFVIFVGVLQSTSEINIKKNAKNSTEQMLSSIPELFSHHIDGTYSQGQHSIGVADEYYYCVIDEREHATYFYFFSFIWPYIDLSAYAILPFCIMFVCNIAIIKNAKFSPPILTYANDSLHCGEHSRQFKQQKSTTPHITTTTIIIPPTPSAEIDNNAGNCGGGYQSSLTNENSPASVNSMSNKKNVRTLSRQKRLDIETPATSSHSTSVPTNLLTNSSIKKITPNYLQPPTVPLLSVENNLLHDDLTKKNKINKKYLNEMTEASCSIDTILNVENQRESNVDVGLIKQNEITTRGSSKWNFILRKLWFINRKQKRNNFTFKNGTLVKTNTNLSSQLSNNSFVLETKPKPPKLITDDLNGRYFSHAPFHSHNHQNHNHHFFSSQLNFYQRHSSPYLQRTISQKFNSSRPIANFHSRNIRMMSLTIMFVSCIFILLTLPIMLFIVLDKIDFKRPSLVERTNCKPVVWACVNLFMYVNHSINFVLYCLTGSKFRTELATLFISPHKIVNATMPELNFNFIGSSRRSSNANNGNNHVMMTNSAMNLSTYSPNGEINYGNNSSSRLRLRSVFVKTHSSDL